MGIYTWGKYQKGYLSEKYQKDDTNVNRHLSWVTVIFFNFFLDSYFFCNEHVFLFIQKVMCSNYDKDKPMWYINLFFSPTEKAMMQG